MRFIRQQRTQVRSGLAPCSALLCSALLCWQSHRLSSKAKQQNSYLMGPAAQTLHALCIMPCVCSQTTAPTPATASTARTQI